MVDVEKPEHGEMSVPEEPKQKEEGGDAKAATTAEEKKKTKTAKPSEPSEPVVMDDEQEYSEEEFKRFVDLYDRTMQDISEGQLIEGRILAVTDQDVLVDIGFKSEGSVPIEEFGDPSKIKIGDTVEVFLDTLEDSDGQLILSKRKANFMRIWDKVVKVHNDGDTIEGICTRRIKGGIVVDLMGVDAFLPGSQIDVKPIRDFDDLIGKTFTFKIVKVNKLRKNIVVSRRVLLEESMAEQRETILKELEKGQIREGTVKNITDFGVFVDLGGVDGLLHINDISWGRINHPSEVVKLDEVIKVVVLDFNDAKDRISLGMKQLQQHPWEDIETKYPEGAVVKGKVVSIADYGAFIELEKGIEGLIHVSEMSWTRHTVHPAKILNVGDIIEVKVLKVDKERKRISLGLKQLTPDPWENIEERFPAGSKFKGTVRNMTNFGVFVEMEEGIDGLIHISDLSWTKKIKHPSEVLKKGEEIEVVILEINKDERRISLGYKQLETDPWPAFEEAYKVDTMTTGKVVRLIEKGYIVELPLGLEGFVPLSQLDESSMEKVNQNTKVGDEKQLVVIEFDRDNKRVVLSAKRLKEMEKEGETKAEKKDVEAYMEKQDDKATLGDIAGEELITKEEAKPEKKEKAEKKPKGKKADEKADDEKAESKKKTAKAKSDDKAEKEKADENAEPVKEEKEEKEDKDKKASSKRTKKEDKEE